MSVSHQKKEKPYNCDFFRSKSWSHACDPSLYSDDSPLLRRTIILHKTCHLFTCLRGSLVAAPFLHRACSSSGWPFVHHACSSSRGPVDGPFNSGYPRLELDWARESLVIGKEKCEEWMGTPIAGRCRIDTGLPNASLSDYMFLKYIEIPQTSDLQLSFSQHVLTPKSLGLHRTHHIDHIISYHTISYHTISHHIIYILFTENTIHVFQACRRLAHSQLTSWHNTKQTHELHACLNFPNLSKICQSALS